jgi:hypothetical protein
VPILVVREVKSQVSRRVTLDRFTHAVGVIAHHDFEYADAGLARLSRSFEG